MEGTSKSDVLETTLEKENINDTIEITDVAKRNIFIGWGLFAIGMFTGIFYIAGFIWALFNKGNATTEYERTHYKGMTSMFIWSAVLYVVGIITSFILIGFILIAGVYIWNIYRIVVGLIKASENKSFPVKK